MLHWSGRDAGNVISGPLCTTFCHSTKRGYWILMADGRTHDGRTRDAAGQIVSGLCARFLRKSIDVRQAELLRERDTFPWLKSWDVRVIPCYLRTRVGGWTWHWLWISSCYPVNSQLVADRVQALSLGILGSFGSWIICNYVQLLQRQRWSLDDGDNPIVYNYGEADLCASSTIPPMVSL